jgi:DNA-binding NarL/FixJ family response regulator
MNISLVHKNLLLVDALKTLFEMLPEFGTVSTYTLGDTFLEDAEVAPPDLLIMDLETTVLDGRDLLEIGRKRLPEELKIVVFSEITDVQNIKLMIKRGVQGILSQSTTFEELKECVTTIAAGNQYIGNSLKTSLINSVFTSDSIALHLSPRENEVLQRVCGGSTIKEIAYDLKLSAHTVQYYHRSVMDKLKVKRTTDLIVYAIQHKLYVPESK